MRNLSDVEVFCPYGEIHQPSWVGSILDLAEVICRPDRAPLGKALKRLDNQKLQEVD